MPKKRAILIGINEYPFLPEFAQLKGCLNDVLMFNSVLSEKFGFKSKNITILTEKKASRNNILKEMRSLYKNCENNDSIVFFFTGHGSRIKTENFDKPTGWYETIMPYDSWRKGSSKNSDKGLKKNDLIKECRDITDDEIYGWLLQLSKKTQNIVVIFDSCFAGSIVRQEDNFVKKSGIVPSNKTCLEVQNAFPFNNSETPKNKKGISGWLPLSKNYVLLAAAREYEPANILAEESDTETKEYGVFTYYLCQALREASKGDTYRDIWEKCYIGVKNHYDDQNPQLEGNYDRTIFGLNEIVPFRFISIENRKKDRIFLSGGRIHGVYKGSIWGIYKSGTKVVKKDEKNLLAKIKIVFTSTMSAEAILLDEFKQGSVKKGDRAVEVSYPKGKKLLRVLVESELFQFKDYVTELRKHINRSKSLKTIEKEELADVKIQIQPIINKTKHSKHKKIAYVWSVVGKNDKLLFPAIDIDEDNINFKVIINNLQSLYEYFEVLNLRNPDSVLRDEVDFIILKQNSDKDWAELKPTGDNPNMIIKTSDRIALRVVNRSDSPIFFSILDLGLSKKISVLYPRFKDSKMLGSYKFNYESLTNIEGGNGVFTIGQKKNEIFELSFPPNFPFILSENNKENVQREGLEIYKLIVTTRPHNLNILEQDSFRNIQIDNKLITNDSIFVKYRGDNDFGEKTLSRLENEWLTIEKPFILKDDNK